MTDKETTLAMIVSVITNVDNEALAEMGGDIGLLGELMRSELQQRGHQVSFSNSNGVVAYTALLTGDQIPESLVAGGSTVDEIAVLEDEAPVEMAIDPEVAEELEAFFDEGEDV